MIVLYCKPNFELYPGIYFLYWKSKTKYNINDQNGTIKINFIIIPWMKKSYFIKNSKISFYNLFKKRKWNINIYNYIIYKTLYLFNKNQNSN